MVISLQIPTDVNAWLEALAAKEMTTKSAIIRRFIAREIESEKRNGNHADTKRDV